MGNEGSREMSQEELNQNLRNPQDSNKNEFDSQEALEYQSLKNKIKKEKLAQQQQISGTSSPRGFSSSANDTPKDTPRDTPRESVANKRPIPALVSVTSPSSTITSSPDSTPPFKASTSIPPPGDSFTKLPAPMKSSPENSQTKTRNSTSKSGDLESMRSNSLPSSSTTNSTKSIPSPRKSSEYPRSDNSETTRAVLRAASERSPERNEGSVTSIARDDSFTRRIHSPVAAHRASVKASSPLGNISPEDSVASIEATTTSPSASKEGESPESSLESIESPTKKGLFAKIGKAASKTKRFFGGTTESKENAISIDIDDVIARLIASKGKEYYGKKLAIRKEEIVYMCHKGIEIVMNQPNLLELAAPVHVAGDIHGQFEDLIRLFEMCGFPPKTNYLFMGDYVDRGKQSLETILLLMAYKIKYPENFFILRGNHECANVNKVYGFFDECKRRTNVKVWKHFTNFFNCLPIAALVSGKIFCVHGGLSPDLKNFKDIIKMQRPMDVPSSGLLNDLLWSDPSPNIEGWAENDRGVSYYFGRKAIDVFLREFDIDLVCRAHMVVEDGYEFFNERRLVTVFSAPNYCGEFDNKGAIMTVDDKLMCSFKILEASTPIIGVPLSHELTILPK